MIIVMATNHNGDREFNIRNQRNITNDPIILYIQWIVRLELNSNTLEEYSKIKQ